MSAVAAYWLGMDAESARRYLLSLAHVEETMQWGENLVFWVGDKAIGGKMFAVMNLGASGNVLALAAGAERFAELVEREGIVPAPYFARIYWVSLQQWDAVRNDELKEWLAHAHQLVWQKLPLRTRQVLAMPARERTRLVAERKKMLAGDAQQKSVRARKPRVAAKRRVD